MKYRKRSSFAKLFDRDDGATIIEFALVAPVFFLVIFGMFEFGLFMYHKVIIENIAVEVSRAASLGKTSDGGDCSYPNDAAGRISYIECVVKQKSSVLINGDKTEVQIVNLQNGETIVPDICFDTDPPSSSPGTCTVYEEVNGKPEYQGAAASEASGGGALIEVRISYPWSVQIPLMNQFFQRTDSQGNTRNVVMITASAVIRNEPFN
jgi:hypothetical protein